MPAIDFKTLMQQERARRKHQQQQEQESGDGGDESSSSSFAARVDAALALHTQTDIVPAAPAAAAASPAVDDIWAMAAAKTVEQAKQAKHLLTTTLDPDYLAESTTPRDMPSYALSGAPTGIWYIPDFVCEELEEDIIEIAHSVPAAHPQWVRVRGRRLQCYGGEPTEPFKAQKLPSWVQQLCGSLMLAGVFEKEEEKPDHVLLNEYAPGQGIMAHTDGPFFRDRVAILSLGGPAIFRFRKRLATSEVDGREGLGKEENEKAVGTVVLQPRSLIVFTGEAYHEMMHEILPVEEEVIGGEDGQTPVLNLGAKSQTIVEGEKEVKMGEVVQRKLRVSLTFRKVNPERPVPRLEQREEGKGGD